MSARAWRRGCRRCKPALTRAPRRSLKSTVTRTDAGAAAALRSGSSAALLSDSCGSETMAVPAVALNSDERYFLGVERSVCGRAWRDRLDARGQALALAIAQRHGLPELLARVLAGRGVEADSVEAFLDPTIKGLMPDPHTLTGMQAAATRIADAIMREEKIA